MGQHIEFIKSHIGSYLNLTLQTNPIKFDYVLCFKNADYTTGQIFDIADKLEEAEAQLGKGGFVGALDFPESTQLSEDKLLKVCKDR